MTADQLAGLDHRVTDEAGQPVTERTAIRNWKWFLIRRDEGPAGVILHVSIPWYMTAVQAYRDQAAAERAAKAIYARYRDAVRALSDRSEYTRGQRSCLTPSPSPRP